MPTALLVIAVVSVDAATKVVATGLAIKGYGRSGLLSLHNPDFLLGIANLPLPLMLLASSLGIVSFGGYTLWRVHRGQVFRWVPGLLIGGGLANILDRLLFGSVHDWLRLPMVVINLADAAVVIGIVGFFVSLATRRERAAGEAR